MIAVVVVVVVVVVVRLSFKLVAVHEKSHLVIMKRVAHFDLMFQYVCCCGCY